MALATYEQVKLLHPDVRIVDDDVADEVLEYASAYVLSELAAHGKSEGDVPLSNIGYVVCNVARRLLGSDSANMPDVSQMSMTVGAVSQQWTLDAPTGNARLDRGDRKMLGISGGAIGFAEFGA